MMLPSSFLAGAVCLRIQWWESSGTLFDYHFVRTRGGWSTFQLANGHFPVSRNTQSHRDSVGMQFVWHQPLSLAMSEKTQGI